MLDRKQHSTVHQKRISTATAATRSTTTALHALPDDPDISRRSFWRHSSCSAGLPIILMGLGSSMPSVAAAASIDAALLQDLKLSKTKLEPIPDLLEQKEWDKVRSILKLPPVNKLWNLGDGSDYVIC
jgi:hypothetical protein